MGITVSEQWTTIAELAQLQWSSAHRAELPEHTLPVLAELLTTSTPCFSTRKSLGMLERIGVWMRAPVA
jgi:hypothetical protein